MILYAFNIGADYPVYTKQIPARQDPVSGKWMIPAYATDIKLIPEKSGYQRYFKDGEWHYVVDNVGTDYWLEDDTKHTITELGEELPEGALQEAPPAVKTYSQELAELNLDKSSKEDDLAKKMSKIRMRNGVAEEPTVTAMRGAMLTVIDSDYTAAKAALRLKHFGEE